MSVYTDNMKIEVREPTYLVLTALAAGRLHGYGIVREVQALSGGDVRLRAGTLYAMLDRLAGEGLVEAAGEEVVEGRLRRYYRLTRAGASMLEATSRQRRALADIAVRRLKASPELLAGGLA